MGQNGSKGYTQAIHQPRYKNNQSYSNSQKSSQPYQSTSRQRNNDQQQPLSHHQKHQGQSPRQPNDSNINKQQFRNQNQRRPSNDFVQNKPTEEPKMVVKVVVVQPSEQPPPNPYHSGPAFYPGSSTYQCPPPQQFYYGSNQTYYPGASRGGQGYQQFENDSHNYNRRGGYNRGRGRRPRNKQDNGKKIVESE